MGIATLGSVEGGRVQRALNGEKINSPKAIAIDAATGAAGGVVMHGVDKIVPAASAGMNGSQATGYIFRTQENAAAENTVRNVGKQILTNAANGGLSVENSNLQNQASQQQTQQQQKDDQTLDQIESNPVGLSPEHISHNVNPK